MIALTLDSIRSSRFSFMCSNRSWKSSTRVSFILFISVVTVVLMNRRRRASYACCRLRSAASCCAARWRASFSHRCCCLTHSRLVLRLLLRCVSCAFEAAAGRGVGVLGTATFTGFTSGAIFSHAVARFSLRSMRSMKVLTIACSDLVRLSHVDYWQRLAVPKKYDRRDLQAGGL